MMKDDKSFHKTEIKGEKFEFMDKINRVKCEMILCYTHYCVNIRADILNKKGPQKSNV
jgi:hypothetical protein